jgi:hypothetical protein
MDAIDFEWGRCLDGYRVECRDGRRLARRGRQPLLSEPRPPVAGIVSITRRFERYRPTAFPDLFRRFADAPSTAEGMRVFANLFGLVTGFGDPSTTREAASLDDVLAHHAALRGAVALVEAGDLAAVARRYNAGWGQLATELRLQPDGGAALVLRPRNLIHFLWVQFALHATGAARLFRCLRCGGAFHVGTGTGRRNTAKFCSNACKTADYRARQGGKNHA